MAFISLRSNGNRAGYKELLSGENITISEDETTVSITAPGGGTPGPPGPEGPQGPRKATRDTLDLPVRLGRMALKVRLGVMGHKDRRDRQAS